MAEQQTESSVHWIGGRRDFHFIANAFQCEDRYAQCLENAYRKSTKPRITGTSTDGDFSFKCTFKDIIEEELNGRKLYPVTSIETDILNYNKVLDDEQTKSVIFDGCIFQVNLSAIIGLTQDLINDADVAVILNTGLVFDVGVQRVLIFYSRNDFDGVYLQPNPIDAMDKGPLFLRFLIRRGTQLKEKSTLFNIDYCQVQSREPKEEDSGNIYLQADNSPESAIYNLREGTTFRQRAIIFPQRQTFDDHRYRLTHTDPRKAIPSEDLLNESGTDPTTSTPPSTNEMCIIFPECRLHFKFRYGEKFKNMSPKMGINDNLKYFCGANIEKHATNYLRYSKLFAELESKANGNKRMLKLLDCFCRTVDDAKKHYMKLSELSELSFEISVKNLKANLGNRMRNDTPVSQRIQESLTKLRDCTNTVDDGTFIVKIE